MVYRFGMVTVALALVLVLLLKTQLVPDLLWAWLIAFSSVAFLTYGYDKLISSSDRTRVPEKVLLLLAFFGGSPGALAGMQLFRHKTAKQSFQQAFWVVVLLQIVIAVVFIIVLQALKATK